jgi:hypothetical protein
MCSAPFDLKIMFEMQKNRELLFKGAAIGGELSNNAEFLKLFEAFGKLQRSNPKIFAQLCQRFWETVAVELLKNQMPTPKVKSPT